MLSPLLISNLAMIFLASSSSTSRLILFIAEHRSFTMSQAPAPREFKFVGAFSRKRRRRNGTIGLETAAAVVTQSTGSAASPPALNDEKTQATRKKPRKTSSPTSVQPAEAPASVTVDPFSCEETPNPLDHEMMLPSPQEGVRQDGEIDWSYSSFMNPFLDPGPSLLTPMSHHHDGLHQLPVYFGPDIPPIHLEETSSTDNSPDNNFTAPPTAATEGDPLAISEILLPPFNFQDAPSNISLTITQLLTRCMCVVSYVLLRVSHRQ